MYSDFSKSYRNFIVEPAHCAYVLTTDYKIYPLMATQSSIEMVLRELQCKPTYRLTS